MSDQYNATIISREEINPALLVIRVKPDGSLYDFIAGQYATLGLLGSAPRIEGADPEPKPAPPEKLIRRAYSIASGSLTKEYIEFIVTLVQDGEFTPRLYQLQIGDRLWMAPRAKGVFTLDKVPLGKHVLMIATGTGLAPYMSFLRTHLTPEAMRKYVILHGARYSWDLGYRAELETLTRVCANFTYIPSITRPQTDPFFTGDIGRIQALLDKDIVKERTDIPMDPEVLDIFLCGNPDMITQTTAWLEARGFQEGKGKNPGTIHTEKYW